jgi:hypothetical protein
VKRASSKAGDEVAKKDCWFGLLCGTVILHVFIFFLCPRWALEPRPSPYYVFLGATLVYLLARLSLGASFYFSFTGVDASGSFHMLPWLARCFGYSWRRS